MARDRDDKQGLGAGIAMVPGSMGSCILITVLTIMLAAFAGHPKLDPVLRSLYFAVLFAAFHAIRRRERSLDTTALRLVELGFFVLTLGFSAFAVLRLTSLESESRVLFLLSQTFEKGAVFLLGVSLISYGILLFLPALVQRYRELQDDYVEVQDSHNSMEKRIVEADRYRALGELAAGVAHDLRNPLTIVKTATESLARKARRPEEVAEHGKVIARNVEKAERTIAALLDLAKPREMSLREHDLAELVTEIATLVKPEAHRRKVEVRREFAAGLTVWTDQKLLHQALLNLLLNAMQASSPGTHVVMRTRHFTLSDAEFLAVVVEDRGSGLQSTDRSKLFSPFFTTKEEGTGLGLLSCRRILDDLRGSIGLFPRIRGGSRAIILLPVQHAEVLC